MGSSLLTLVQYAQAELGLFPAASTVQAATDDTVMQMFALINRVGDDVAQRKDWTALQTIATISIVGSQQSYTLPSDFRHVINRTEWDYTNHWELMGPASPQEWEWITRGTIATGPRKRFRIMGTSLLVWPTPGVSDTGTLSYEYVSKYWARAADGVTTQARLVLDTDTAIFPDDVMITGLKWRFFATKGFDTVQLQVDHENAVRIAMAQDGGAKTLGLSPMGWGTQLIGPQNVPDTGFGV